MSSGLEDLQKVSTSASKSASHQNTIYNEIAAANSDGIINSTTGLGTGPAFIENTFGGLDEIPFVGMNTDSIKVKNMRNAILNYVSNVKTCIAGLETDESAAKAFGPEVAVEVKNYVAGMKEAIFAITSNLERFAADIDNVAAAYRAKGDAIVSDVKGVTSSISTAASRNKYSYISDTSDSNRSN